MSDLDEAAEYLRTFLIHNPDVYPGLEPEILVNLTGLSLSDCPLPHVDSFFPADLRVASRVLADYVCTGKIADTHPKLVERSLYVTRCWNAAASFPGIFVSEQL